MASFIATTNDRPEAFSLFSCGPQPLEKKSLTGGADDSDAVDDLMRMQLKVADSTTGLSDKDIKKLTRIHVVPCDFRALAELFENMAGVTELIFGSAAPITLMLGSWVHFLTRTGGTTVANLRRLAFEDATGSEPPRVAERQHLEDGMFLPPLCPYLKAKLGPADATRAATSGGGASGKGGSSYPTSTVRNPSGRLFKITSRDVWQVFLDHAKEAPVPNLCCRYHLNGVCNESCFFRASHVALTGEQSTALGKWIESCRARMPSRQPADAAKKPKLVGDPDTAYNFLPKETWTLPHTNVGKAHNELLPHSAAAGLYALPWATVDHHRHVAGANGLLPAAPPLASLARTSARTTSPGAPARSKSPCSSARPTSHATATATSASAVTLTHRFDTIRTTTHKTDAPPAPTATLTRPFCYDTDDAATCTHPT
ncbi:hypothetical protein MHU86_16103 [Fragilaria crotonensis]|nr:hypothetical protein MHU86_16103 [Fragilaria crotonensis]